MVQRLIPRIVFAAVSLFALMFSAPTASAVTGEQSYRTRSAGIRLQVLTASGSKIKSKSDIDGYTDFSTQTSPQLFVVYRPSKRFGFELAIGNHRPIDTSHSRVRLRDSVLGEVDLGTVRMFPLTLTGQYRFTGLGKFEPYIAAGLNYIMYFKHEIPADVSDDVTYDDHLGLVIGAGVDYALGDNWFLNVDIKFLTQRTAIIVGDRDRNKDGDYRFSTNVNPLLVSLGVGYHF